MRILSSARKQDAEHAVLHMQRYPNNGRRRDLEEKDSERLSDFIKNILICV